MEHAINLKQTGIVFNIQKFSVHDGPGIRTIVFVKGCPLSCLWCSNPESQSPEPVVQFNEVNCIHCGKCIYACPTGAVDPKVKGLIRRDRCINCGSCAEVCNAKALVMSGKVMDVETVLAELMKDAVHYRRSGGGITLSGGEPLTQPDFVEALLKACKKQGLHTAMETTGIASEAVLKRIIPLLDLVLLDIKAIDPDIHKRFTGVSSIPLLENALRIAQLAKQISIRVPVIPGFNCDEASITHIARFVKYLPGVNVVHLLPYHSMGKNKYEITGMAYTMEDIKPPDQQTMKRLQEIVAAHGLQCMIGG